MLGQTFFHHFLSSFLTILLCCSSRGFNTFPNPSRQQTQESQALSREEIMTENFGSEPSYQLTNTSLCKTNINYLTEQEKELRNIFCRNVIFTERDTERDSKMRVPDFKDSEMLLKRLSVPALTSFVRVAENRGEIDEVKSKRVQGGRALPCRFVPQTYGENEPLPWTCRQRKEWLTLPDNLYPNRVYVTVCESSSCMNGHFNCTPVTYNLELLKMCYGSQCHDDRIPYSLRSSWTFHEYPVTIGCSCTR
ncbi:protein trunk [Biomphalaria glabrata]|nr:protein trunk-like [Biomphalaria glabrata]KAI8774509.1 protein trunk [Biomphalaria glabrata]